MDDLVEQRRKQHWKHLMNAARRHATERGERMAVLGQPFSYRGVNGWHYVIVPATHLLAQKRAYTRQVEQYLRSARRDAP